MGCVRAHAFGSATHRPLAVQLGAQRLTRGAACRHLGHRSAVRRAHHVASVVLPGEAQTGGDSQHGTSLVRIRNVPRMGPVRYDHWAPSHPPTPESWRARSSQSVHEHEADEEDQFVKSPLPHD